MVVAARKTGIRVGFRSLPVQSVYFMAHGD
jgi:hypothetical protein